MYKDYVSIMMNTQYIRFPSSPYTCVISKCRFTFFYILQALFYYWQFISCYFYRSSIFIIWLLHLLFMCFNFSSKFHCCSTFLIFLLFSLLSLSSFSIYRFLQNSSTVKECFPYFKTGNITKNPISSFFC